LKYEEVLKPSLNEGGCPKDRGEFWKQRNEGFSLSTHLLTEFGKLLQIVELCLK
jgi:hypothetical protein